MAVATRVGAVQGAFARGGLPQVFLEELGWGAPVEGSFEVSAGDSSLRAEPIADLKGFRVYTVEARKRPTRQLMRAVDSSLAELSPERMQIFQSQDAWIWHWPRQTSTGTETFEAIETAPGALPTFLAQRLTGLQFTLDEHRLGFTLADVRNRVYGRFDSRPVTKKFYDRFAAEHRNLASAIKGLSEDESFGYATTLLNRLMFIYFMQKKEFVNDDPFYLETTLRKVRELRGRDHYYTFYRDALLPLFFQKLDRREGEVEDEEIGAILGRVPYVNGGIFGRTEIELTNPNSIDVPDSAFESVLAFFGEFNWHLDTRATGNPDEINPEVVGYIFEQYINFASSGKKEHGAYYTAHDVTAHMVAQTLVPRILDSVGSDLAVFDLLQANPDRYIQPAMLHGWVNGAWCLVEDGLLQIWAGDPTGWGSLDAAPANHDAQLPAETWVETFHRRERVESLRARIASGEVCRVNDLITENLNSQLLLTDAIDQIVEPTAISRLFHELTELAVFDPTCGSGAFLFAALEALEEIYAHVIDAARSRPGNTEVAELLAQVDAQPSARYFIRKHIAIRNLYGTDLMPGAIETAKLRIFLSLAACVETPNELQPLPDLDFNLKVGNLVVGFKDVDDVYRVAPEDILVAPRLIALEPQIDEYANLYDEFVAAVESASATLSTLKAELQAKEHDLRRESNEIYAEATRVQPTELDEWLERVRPFHWFCEFPGVLRRGGFDVILGNPPYVRMTQLPGYTAVGYDTSGCPDLFAVCYERSLSLLAPEGRHAFIVMAAMSISEDYRPLREVIANRAGAEWWSTYGRIPAGLFASGVRVRNTILILGPGDAVYATRHHLHTNAQRPWLFPTIEFAAVKREKGAWPVRGGIATPMLNQLAALPPLTGAPSDKVVFVRPTATYWVPILPGEAPVLDANWQVIQDRDGRLKKINLTRGEEPRDVVAFCGGKLTYLWWVLVGDDFDVNPRELDTPRALTKVAASYPGWEQAIETVHGAIRSATFISVNAKKYYFNVRWNKLRSVTDQLDRIALTALGGTDDDWRAVNILYRQVMRSSGDSAKGRYVTDEEFDKYLAW